MKVPYQYYLKDSLDLQLKIKICHGLEKEIDKGRSKNMFHFVSVFQLPENY